jgi:tRNA-dihydrouridine synthase 3
MAVAYNILKGQKTELSLLRRHESEKCFGIQVAGSDARLMSQLAQFVDENLDVDFVDINCGCPIDSICKRGMGSQLMSKKNKLEGIVRGMTEILRIPLTVKMRTSLVDGKDIAHSLFPMVQEWGASAVTLHGRSKQQRYSKEARWDYIGECSKTVNIPFIGNGDVFSHFDLLEHKEKYPNVSSFMIGRGALIKPWLFTELKEERVWDISASERFEIIKKFCNYGLDHYGSDQFGVEKTRRFFLEWQSFLCRYVPVGLIERDPPRYKMNERPPLFIGRNDLETLMASQNVQKRCICFAVWGQQTGWYC